MGNILKDSSGNVIISSGNAFEVTASVDSNIVAGNIKKDVTILGVTGTYEGGGGSSEIPVVVVSGTTVTQTLSPNIHYVFKCMDSLTITLGTPVSGVVNEYSFEFDSGDNTATALTLPSNIIFESDTVPTYNKHYEYNIKYNEDTGDYFGLLSNWTYIILPDNSILVDKKLNTDSDTPQTGNVLKVSSNYNPSNGIKIYYFDAVTNHLVLTNTAYSDGTNLTMTYGYQTVNIFTATNPATFEDFKPEGAPCFAIDTLITLSDGTKKKIQDITYDDELLIWDFDNGKQSFAKPLWITRKLSTNSYHKVSLSDGTELNLIGTVSYHRLYSIDDNCFIPSVDMIGKRTIKENGEIVTVLDWVNIAEEIEYYNVITEYHLNCYAESILTSCRYNSIYPISDSMRYIKDDRSIIPYSEYEGKIDKKYYEGLRVGEQQFSIVEVMNYCNNMVRTRKEGI